MKLYKKIGSSYEISDMSEFTKEYEDEMLKQKNITDKKRKRLSNIAIIIAAILMIIFFAVFYYSGEEHTAIGVIIGFSSIIAGVIAINLGDSLPTSIFENISHLDNEDRIDVYDYVERKISKYKR